MAERVEQRICIKFCVKLQHSSTETIMMVQKAFGDDAMSATVVKWDGINIYRGLNVLTEISCEGCFDSTSLAVNNNNSIKLSNFDLHTKEMCRSVSRDRLTRHHYNSLHSNSKAISINAQKCGRPRSATNSGTSCTGCTTMTWPTSATSQNAVALSHNSIATTSNPVVDTYNERAIQDALKRMALRHKYSVNPETEVIKTSSCDVHTAPSASQEKHIFPQKLTGSIAEDHLTHLEAKQFSSSISNHSRQPLNSEVNSPKPPQMQQTAAAAFDNFTEDMNSHLKRYKAHKRVAGVTSPNCHVTQIIHNIRQSDSRRSIRRRNASVNSGLLPTEQGQQS